MKKYILKIGIIVLILMLIISGTYAYWTWNSTNNKNITFSTTGIRDYIIYDEGESYFVGDYQAYNTFCESVHTTISIYKTNDAANMDLRASIKMDVNSIGDNIKASDNVYYVVTRGNSNITCNSGLSESNVISSGTFKNVSSGDTLTLANNIEITSNEVEYTIWIWIDSTGEDIASLSLEILDTNIWTQVDMLDGSSINSNDIVNVVVNDGMIPVVISDDGTVTTISENDNSWYDYNNKKWANAILVNESSRSSYIDTTGVEVQESDILAYYVWIPRYKYKIWTTSVSSIGKEQTIDIVFENKETPKSKGTKVGEYLTHPAFTFGTEELDGFWVGKFETTGTGDSPTVLPNTTSLRSQNVSTQFQTSLKFAGGTLSNGAVYFSGNPTYGLTNETNSHMMKNSEWGAVAYLSHSIYGINEEIYINNSEDYYTGRSGGAVGGNASKTTYGTYSWLGQTVSTSNILGIIADKTLGTKASTTGNLTGIYDMSGGAAEYTMGTYSSNNGNLCTGNSLTLNSGFNGMVYENGNNVNFTLGINFPSSKYYDLYLALSNSNCTLVTCGGQALFETTGWYSDNYDFISLARPWVTRGGRNTYNSSSGIFSLYSSYGYANSYYSWRSVLTKTEYTTYYSINYDANGGSNAPSRQIINEDNPSVSISNVIPAREGYRFLNWNTEQDGSGITYRAGDTYNTSANITLYAQWSLKTYIVILDNQNATSSGTNKIYGKYSIGLYKDNEYTSQITTSNNAITIPSKTGYTFGGYYIETSGNGTQIINENGYLSSSFTNTMYTEDTTLYAKWTPNTYTLSITKGTGVDAIYYKVNNASEYSSSSNNVSTSVQYGTSYYYYGVASTGYSMSSCTQDNPCNGTVGANDINKSLSATLNTYTLSITKGTGVSTIYYKVNGASEYSLTSGNVLTSAYYGTSYYYYGVASTGYTLSSCTSSNPCTGTMGTGYSNTLNANANSYMLTFNANGGSVSTTSKYVYYDSTYGDLPTPTRSGYIFIGWFTGSAVNDSSKAYKDYPMYYYADTFDDLYSVFSYNQISLYNHYTNNGKSEGRRISEYISSDTVKITSNTTLYAGWLGQISTVTFNAYGGSVSTTSKYVMYNSTYGDLPTPTRSGYTFIGWFTGTAKRDSSKAYRDYPMYYYADTFDDLYNVYSYNETNLYNHYLNNGKSEGRRISEYISSDTVYITSNTTFYAGWRANTYTISYNANGGSGAPSSQTKTYGVTLTLSSTVPTRSGYTFLGWSTSSSATSATYAAGGSFTTNANTTLYAVWKQSGIPTFTYTGTYEIVDDNDNTITNISSYSGNWKIRFLTSGTLSFNTLGNASSGIDLFLVGGGGAGNKYYSTSISGEVVTPIYNGGGGGGYTLTVKKISIQTGVGYSIVVGAGNAVSANNAFATPLQAGSSTAFGYEAKGGFDGQPWSGGNGGSGGGAQARAGGSDGGNGSTYATASDLTAVGGTGQGTTTREFGESSGKLYAYGGDGGSATSAGGGSNGYTANTGDGGVGRCNINSCYNLTDHGAYQGASGIVIIRNAR